MPVAENIRKCCDEFYRSAAREVEAKRNTVIIGFGHRARQGKDTVVEHLVKKYAERKLVVQRYSFAEALKVEVFDWLQATAFIEFTYDGIIVPNRILPGGFYINRNYSRSEKVAYIEAHKVVLRPLLQKWGTDFRRSQDKNYWVEKLRAQIAADNPHAALISDMRFENEAEICDETVRVERVGYVETDPSIGQHISETAMNSYPYDHVLEAEDGNLAGLLYKAEEVFDKILAERRILIR